MRPENDPYYKAQLKAIELEYMLDSPTVTNMPNRSIEVTNDDPKPLPDIMSFGQCMEFATNPNERGRCHCACQKSHKFKAPNNFNTNQKSHKR